MEMYILHFFSRYKRRERGKLVNAYSSKDLEGILVSIEVTESLFFMAVFLLWVLSNFMNEL